MFVIGLWIIGVEIIFLLSIMVNGCLIFCCVILVNVWVFEVLKWKVIIGLFVFCLKVI